jgi:hypothetical protein
MGRSINTFLGGYMGKKWKGSFEFGGGTVKMFEIVFVKKFFFFELS